MRADLLVVGGGWAGCSAAWHASRRGLKVAVVEAAPCLGGRASSFRDPDSGEWLDHGRHLFLGAYRETLELLSDLGTAPLVEFTRPLRIPFLLDDGRLRVLQASRAPGPLSLALGLARFGRDRGAAASLLRLGVRGGAALGAARFGRLPRFSSNRNIADWLKDCGQNPALIALVWEPMVVAALNAKPDQARLREFLAVLGSGFLKGGFSASLGMARAPLAKLLSPLPAALRAAGSEIHLGAVARSLEPLPAGGWRLSLQGAAALEADQVVVAVPARRGQSLLGPALSGLLDLGPQARRPASAIVSVWLWSDEPILPEGMLAFGPQGPQAPPFHWGFSDPQGATWRTCVVSSAADALADRANGEIVSGLASFLAARGRPYHWNRAKVIRSRGATPVFAPGSPARSAQATSLKGLALAGDWTETGLPATIEGAVRSGRLAFEALSFDERRSHV